MILVASKIERAERGEDRLAIEATDQGLLVVVADGAGGTGGGAQAAQAVCDAAVAAVRKQNTEGGSWSARLTEMDLALVKAGHGGLSTAVVAEVLDGQVVGASVGDSCAWLVSLGEVSDLTERQVRKPLLGSGSAEPVAFGPVPLRGRLLVGTDGLFKYASRSRLASLTAEGSPEVAAAALVEAVRLKSGQFQDDVGVVVCEETG